MNADTANLVVAIGVGLSPKDSELVLAWWSSELDQYLTRHDELTKRGLNYSGLSKVVGRPSATRLGRSDCTKGETNCEDCQSAQKILGRLNGWLHSRLRVVDCRPKRRRAAATDRAPALLEDSNDY
jgi:hypothetical protein